MSSLFDKIGEAVADGELAAAKALGVTMGFKHRDELPIPVKVSFAQQKLGAEQMQSSRLAEVGEILMYVPAQSYAFSGVSGFSGSYAISAATGTAKTAYITVGDRWEYPIGSGRYFRVVRDGVRSVDNGWIYEVVIREERGITFGQGS